MSKSYHICSNLTVPKPSFTVLASSATTSIATEKLQKAKSKKLMVPNTSSTVRYDVIFISNSSTITMGHFRSSSIRNLFAIDYLKDHAVTAAEFKVIFDNLSKEELQVCLTVSTIAAVTTLIMIMMILCRNTKFSAKKRNGKLRLWELETDLGVAQALSTHYTQAASAGVYYLQFKHFYFGSLPVANPNMMLSG